MKRQCFGLMVLLAAASATARADFLIRIGDIDGFGYGTAPGFKAANGGNANKDGVGPLGNGDFLPDINKNGSLATGEGDEFDFRTSSELANTASAIAPGVTNVATVGSKWTDISLARSYDARSTANRILIGGNPNDGLVFGAGGDFPDSSSNGLPNQPGFVFDFTVNKIALAAGTDIYFNLIFGDFDVVPAQVDITRADNSKKTLTLTRQGGNQDGLIQAATTTLSFGDVFTDGGSVWNGKLKVDFNAPNEPYTAFDYVELSTIPLVSSAVPEPSTFVLGAVGALTLGVSAWRRRRAGTA